MISLFVSCHKQSLVPTHPLLVPIQVGTALAPKEFLGYVHDNTGDNISSLNRSYCELTAQYWAWKNWEADYYGFFHYRRYLYPDLQTKKPYRIEKDLSLAMLQRLNFDAFSDIIPKFDMILPLPEDMHIPVSEHYAHARYHQVEDLKLVEDIVRDLYPSCVPSLDAYLSQTSQYFGNIFIMSRSVFRDYCSWLFPILEEFSYSVDLLSRPPQEMRAPGYLAERLLGVYYLQHRSDLKTLELPRVHFLSGRDYWQKKITNTLLPPESWIRAGTKAIVQSLHRHQ